MTRAIDHLHLVMPHRFYVHQQARTGDRHVYASRTRFIPASILDRFEAKVWAPKSLTVGWRLIDAVQPLDFPSENSQREQTES